MEQNKKQSNPETNETEFRYNYQKYGYIIGGCAGLITAGILILFFKNTKTVSGWISQYPVQILIGAIILEAALFWVLFQINQHFEACNKKKADLEYQIWKLKNSITDSNDTAENKKNSPELKQKMISVQAEQNQIIIFYILSLALFQSGIVILISIIIFLIRQA